MTKVSFSDRLKFYRKKAGYKTAKEFAEKLGMNFTTYAAYEGRNREPRYGVLVEISKALNVTPNDLMGWEAGKEWEMAMWLERVQAYCRERRCIDCAFSDTFAYCFLLQNPEKWEVEKIKKEVQKHYGGK